MWFMDHPTQICPYSNVFADDQTVTSLNPPEVRDKATQRFDLEGLMAQLNVIVKSGKLKRFRTTLKIDISLPNFP